MEKGREIEGEKHQNKYVNFRIRIKIPITERMEHIYTEKQTKNHTILQFIQLQERQMQNNQKNALMKKERKNLMRKCTQII